MLSDMKIILDGINGILYIAKEKVGDFKDIAIKKKKTSKMKHRKKEFP